MNQQIGRLAMRHEGDWWNAYYADHDTMEGAVLLGSIGMAFTDVPAVKLSFMLLMRDVVSNIIEAQTGDKITWGGVEHAPEHERAGHS
jgi:hypothetical protein